jgi:hypothetical protein
LEGGVKLIPNQEITLKGVSDEVILRVFGPIIYGAILGSRLHEKEVEEGKAISECVSMTLTNRSHGRGIIHLCLGLEKGVEIRDTLYPPQRL